MKEKVEEKMSAYIEELLEKDKLSNDEFCVLNMFYQKLQNDEAKMAEKARMEEGNRKMQETMKALMQSF